MSLIAALLLTVGMAQGTSAQGTEARAEAERLAKAGAYAEALQRFQAITAANPNDVDARLWIGRLHLRMGQPARAVGVFESIAATHPQNVDALVGLGQTLMDVGRWDEAGDALNRAEALASDRTDVLAAQGRYHGANNRPTLGLAYYERAILAAPSDQAIRGEADRLRASRAHRAEFWYDFQGYDPSEGEMHSGTGEVNARINDAFRIFGRGQVQEFDGTQEGRGGGGIEWFARRGVRLRAGVLAGDTTWLPRTDVFGDMQFSARRVRWLLTGRFYDFDGVDLVIAGPGLSIDLTSKMALTAHYLISSTSYTFDDSSSASGNGSVAIDAAVTDRFSVSASYSRGIEGLDWMTADRVSGTDANTYAFGASIAMTPFVGLGGSYAYQERTADLTAHRARAGLIIKF
jgi:tetratricopeptide (TPR) repeat protein